MAERIHFGSWEKLDSLGKGGQGEVFKVRRMDAQAHVTRDRIADVIRASSSSANTEHRHKFAEELINSIREIAAEIATRDHAPLGALKVLHDSIDEAASEKAVARMLAELEALKKLEHPSLVRIFESNPQERWFVMEYFNGGTLSTHLQQTQGDVLGSLLALRPVVEAVSNLHKGGYIHRDIKPDNIFVAGDRRLVLGDFGLVINAEGSGSRVTDTYENVGSKEWMPGWAMGMRIDEVRPNFDVFTFGKVLWAMVSGKPYLRLWYYNQPQFNIEEMFPDNRSVRWLQRIFSKTIVERERDCLTSATELLGEVDELIGVLKRNGQVPDRQRLRCVVCGIGYYRPYAGFPDEGREIMLTCNHCGNMQKFLNIERSPGWH